MKERLNKIKEFIDKKGKVDFHELETAFPDVSSMTLRRDLMRLEEKDEVLRVSGGAISVDSVLKTKEKDFSERISFNTEEKLEIAQKAVGLIAPNSCIFIDGGSTATYFARALPDENFYVVTNAIIIAETIFRKHKPSVTFLGGDLLKSNFMTVGKSCLDFISQININTAIMTATSFISESGSFACGSQAEVEIKKAVIRKANKVIMLMDSSKIDKNTPYTFAQVQDVNCMVVDNNFPQRIKEAIINMGVKVY